MGKLCTRTEEEQEMKCIQWLRGRGAGLDQGRRPSSRARCNWGPCGAARRWWGGAARRTGSLWKVHAPSRREESVEASRNLGALQATWHDRCNSKWLQGFHIRRSASRQSACGVARAGRVAASRIGGLIWAVLACYRRTATQFVVG